jgi:hypothetical protein
MEHTGRALDRVTIRDHMFFLNHSNQLRNPSDLWTVGTWEAYRESMETPTLPAAPLDADPAPVAMVSILSVDAWRSACGGWDWNDWHTLNHIRVTICDLTPRALLSYLRSNGYLNRYSAGRVSVVDDGYNVTICERGTLRPILAIAYGEVMS